MIRDMKGRYDTHDTHNYFYIRYLFCQIDNIKKKIFTSFSSGAAMSISSYGTVTSPLIMIK